MHLWGWFAQVHMYAHEQTHTHTQMHSHTNRCTHAHTLAHTHTHARTNTHTHTHARTHAHALAHTYTHAIKHTHTHTHTHTYTHTHTSPAYPVVWEVFVHNLSHLGLLVQENVWLKVEDDIQHGCLCCQCCWSVLRLRVGWDLVVHIVRPQTPNHHVDIFCIDWNSPEKRWR